MCAFKSKLNTEPLTIESLKQCKGFEDITDTEAQDIINSIRIIAQTSVKAVIKEDKL